MSPGLVVRVVDREPRVDADGRAVAPQHPGAQRVEGAHGHVAAWLADEAQDPLAHLGRGLVGERHGEDLPRPHALDADQVRDAVREHARLARAGAGEDEQRPLGRRDGARLLGVEAADDACGELAGILARRAGAAVGASCRTVLADARDGREPGRLLASSSTVGRPAAVAPAAFRPLRRFLDARGSAACSAPPRRAPSGQRLGRWRQLRPVEAVLDRVGHRPMLAGAPCHLASITAAGPIRSAPDVQRREPILVDRERAGLDERRRAPAATAPGRVGAPTTWCARQRAS